MGYSGDGSGSSASGLSAELTKSAASSSSSSECGNGTISGAGSRFIDTVRKALIARVKTQTLTNAEANNNISGGLSKKTSSCSADGSIPSVSKKVTILIYLSTLCMYFKTLHFCNIVVFSCSLAEHCPKVVKRVRPHHPYPVLTFIRYTELPGRFPN